jgi:hypothetical protein
MEVNLLRGKSGEPGRTRTCNPLIKSDCLALSINVPVSHNLYRNDLESKHLDSFPAMHRLAWS